MFRHTFDSAPAFFTAASHALLQMLMVHWVSANARRPVQSYVGLAVGLFVGEGVGLAVGLAVGLTVGLVGLAVGLAVGLVVGLAVGLAVGATVGAVVEFAVGALSSTKAMHLIMQTQRSPRAAFMGTQLL